MDVEHVLNIVFCQMNQSSDQDAGPSVHRLQEVKAASIEITPDPYMHCRH